MPEIAAREAGERLAAAPRPLQWLLLLVLSGLIVAALDFAGVPGGLFLGPMVAGVVAGVNGATVRVPRLPFLAAQGVVGVLVAILLDPGIFAVVHADWPIMLSVVLATVAASSLLGYLVSRWHVLPGTTAVWGVTPGAATAMVLMAGAFGADARLVAFMQYTRVIAVAVTAALVARLFVDLGEAAPAPVAWFPPLDPAAFGATLALIGVGGTLGVLLRIPAGAMLVPMFAGAALQLSGVAAFQLPEWLLAASYALVGWTIGLGFTRPLIRHAARAFPQVAVSVAALIAFCGAIALPLAWALDLDPLSAYLATSPGGMDTIAIIAAASGKVDLPLVMALQTVRFFIVLLLGPFVARAVASRVR